MRRRDLFTNAGLFATGVLIGPHLARASHISYDEYCDIDSGTTTEDETEPLPPREDWGKDNLFFKNQPGLILENFKLQGRIIVVDCPDAIIRNFEIFGSHKNKWGNLTVRNSPRTLIEDGESHDNPYGHGLFLDEDMNGVVVQRFKAWACQEDGVQTNNNAFGMARLTDCVLTNNHENALDMKGGSLCVVRGRYQTMAEDPNTGKSHEPVLIQNFAESLHMDRARLVDTPHSTRNKALLFNTNEGAKVVLEDCEYEIARDFKWFRSDGTQYGLADLGEPFNLVTPDLTVTGGAWV